MRYREAKPVEEILAGANEVNGSAARLERRNLLRNLKDRIQGFEDVFAAGRGLADGDKKEGPSLKQMDKIIEDIEEDIEYIKNYDKYE